MGSFMAIQGLWAVPWLMEVKGLSRAAAANHLLAMNAVIMVGYFLLGSVRHGARTPRHSCAAPVRRRLRDQRRGAGADRREVPGAYLWWSLYGLGAAVNVLALHRAERGLRPRACRTHQHHAQPADVRRQLRRAVGHRRARRRRARGARARRGRRTARRLRRDPRRSTSLTFAWFLRGWRRHGVLHPRSTRRSDAPPHPRHLRHLHGRPRGDRARRPGTASPAATPTSIRR